MPPLREVIASHRLRPRRSLGQNFLHDLNVTRRIARAAGPLSGTTVLEIGPGPGGLTRALLEEGAARVVAVERDPRCAGALEEISAVAGGRLTVIEGDALSFDPASIGDGPVRVVANLPYNVGTALLLRWLKEPGRFDRLVLMFQKEVAERLTAEPGSRRYGRLSVAVQSRCAARRLFDLPPAAFAPPPKVHSSVVALRPAPSAGADPELLEAVAAAAFAQRRKMLRTALAGLFATPDETLANCGIDPRARAEEIDIDGFRALARALETLRRGA